MKINPDKPEIRKIRIAANIIKQGGLVAFPTETVYGLGADALKAEAVEKIFLAKKRPPDNPMIVHVARKDDVYRLTKEVPKDAEKLMSAFWPGPLTLILKRSALVPRITVVGLDTIAIRMPKNKVALMLISEARVPIAAPSANIAGKPSPTQAGHVINDLAGRIDIVLDAGPTRIGVESTVVDMTTRIPTILRPGGVSYEELKTVLGKVKLHPAALTAGRVPMGEVRAPGMKHQHYAPNAQVIVVEGEYEKVVKRVQELVDLYRASKKKVGVFATVESKGLYRADVVRSAGSRDDVAAIARNLFRLLREFDREKADLIVVEGIPAKGLGLAVMNRLRRAANFNVIEVD